MGDFWVFGYGSLIWKPGFEFEIRQKATLKGLNRSLCVYSWVHRGTRENPGLVLGLDHGGSCEGMAMRATGNNRTAIIEYLRAREQVTDVYVEDWRDVVLTSGETVEALVYKVDQTSPQYASGLSLDDQAAIILNSVGGSGPNPEYVANTVSAMKQEGIRDDQLEYVHQRLIQLQRSPD